jgi:hypothetical protein
MFFLKFFDFPKIYILYCVCLIMAKNKAAPRKVASPESEFETETRLYSVKDLPSKPARLYIPEDGETRSGFLEKIRGYWDEYKPKSAFGYAAAVVFPTPYFLWKLPSDLHGYLNDILKGASAISMRAGQPEVAAATGITYAISQAVYGLKTKSGKHVLSGLEGIVTNTKKINLSTLSKADAKVVKDTYKSAKTLLDAIASQNAAEN